VNNELLFNREMEVTETTEASASATLPNQPVMMIPQVSIASCFTYQGIKYSTIIDALLKRIATQGAPRVGERNDDLFLLTRELRHLCDYNFQTVYTLVAPYFPSLQDSEIRRTIANALNTTGRTFTPVLKGVLDELHNENLESADAEEVKVAKLPKVSAIEEMILAHYPKHLRSQVYLASLPIWGMYGTHVRFKYLDGRVNSLSFMTAVVGKSASGKSFAAHLFEQMTQRIQQRDDIERQKADQYLDQCNKSGDGAEKPDDPRPKVRLLGDDISTSQLLEYLKNNDGKHCVQFSEEVARLVKAKRTVYGDNDDLYCKAFDNAVGGKESKSKLTRNIRIPIFLNTLFCGTPGAMHKFYNNPEGGLNNRMIFAFMPKVRSKKIPRYETFTEEERAQFEAVLDTLEEAGKDGQMIELPWLDKAILSIKNRWDREDDENPNDVLSDLGKRAKLIAFRAGVAEYFLRGKPTDEKSLREIVKLVNWVALTVRDGVYAFSGRDYENINEQDEIFEQKRPRQTKNKLLFSLLNAEFTVQELIAQRMQNGEGTNVKMIISRWMADGKIRKVGEGRYCKLAELAA